MSGLFGKMLFNLPTEKQRKTYSKEYLEFYQKCCRSKDLIVRKNAATVLPCVFYYFGSNFEQDEVDFMEIYCEFADDESKEIKSIVARGIHEALTLIEKSGKDVYVFGECI